MAEERPDAYATVAELSASWREFSERELPYVEATLRDASDFLDAQLAASGRSSDEVAPEVLSLVCRSLVRRSMGELDPTGAEAQWQTITDPTAQWSAPAVTHQDLYLTQWERRMLGVRCGRAGFSGAADA
mgnify:CR=1 FL=1